MEVVFYYAVGAIVLYGATNWILSRIEEMRGERFSHRNIIFFVIIFVLALVLMELVNPPPDETSGTSHEATVKHTEEHQERAPLEARFDLPSLLTMKAEEIRTALGMPESEFKATHEQARLGITSTLRYRKGSTLVQIDYDAHGVIQEMFLSDDTAGRTVEEIYELGSLKPGDTAYSLRIQPWLNPSVARRNGEAEIAGIAITR